MADYVGHLMWDFDFKARSKCVDQIRKRIQKLYATINLYSFCLADASPILPVRHIFAPTDQGQGQDRGKTPSPQEQKSK
jgi:hypothetical protein